MKEDTFPQSVATSNKTGWDALYDVLRNEILPAGTVLAAVLSSGLMVFQTAEDFNLFTDIDVRVLGGSATWNTTTPPETVVVVSVSACRFPTREELEVYEKLNTI